MIENMKCFSQHYDKNSPVKIIMVGETYCDEKFNVDREESDLSALEFILDGKGTLEIEGQVLHPKKNDVFYLKLGSHHRYYPDPKSPWHKIWVVFDGTVMQSCADNLLSKDVYLYENCNVRQVFKNIYNMAMKTTESSPKLLDDMTVEFMKIFLYIHSKTVYQTEDLAEKIRHYLEANIEKNFSLDDLCKALNYSKNHIIHIFADKYGMTPYKYYLERKIETAKIYLKNTNFSIGEIAARLCFADQQYFSTSFKGIVGYSPNEYRKKLKNNEI